MMSSFQQDVIWWIWCELLFVRFLREFTCTFRKWKLSYKLHYKRVLGPWESQLCSGVRGDSTLKTWLMDRLLVSVLFHHASLFVICPEQMSYICLFRTLCEIYMVTKQVLPWVKLLGGPGGRVSLGTSAAHFQYAEQCWKNHTDYREFVMPNPAERSF